MKSAVLVIFFLVLPSGSVLAQTPLTDPLGNTPTVQGDSDHAQTIGAWGFQVTGVDSAQVPPAPEVLPMLGVRRWSGTRGWEAGVTAAYVRDGQPEPLGDTSAFVMGGTFGYLWALGIYKHMNVFWEPQGTFLFAIPDEDSGAEEAVIIEGRVNVGTEVRLGMFGLPRIGLTAKIGAGVRVVSQGDTDLELGTTLDPIANSVRGLLQTSVGFVFYM